MDFSNLNDVTFIVCGRSDSGLYRCRGANRGGEAECLLRLAVAGPAGWTWGLVAGTTTAAVLLIVMAAVMVFKIRQYNSKLRRLTAAELKLFTDGDPKNINAALDVHEQTDLLPYNKCVTRELTMVDCIFMVGTSSFRRSVWSSGRCWAQARSARCSRRRPPGS